MVEYGGQSIVQWVQINTMGSGLIDDILINNNTMRNTIIAPLLVVVYVGMNKYGDVGMFA